MLARVLEVEVMDTLAEAVDYDAMDHAEVNRRFVDDFLALAGPAASRGDGAGKPPPRVLDVGTGTAQIPVALCARGVAAQVTAVDFAASMLQLAQKNVLRAGLSQSIRLDHVDAKALPYVDGSFDVVLSNSLIHHIPAPLAVLREMVRVSRPGGWLFVRDLVRPDDEHTLAHLVATYAADANERQCRMFGDSLHAALTLEEVRQMLGDLGLPRHLAAQTSDRHWTIAGEVDGRQ